MKIEQLRRLVAIVKSGSFEACARQTYVEKEELADSMAQLETELGVKIFENHEDEAILTSFGLDIYRQAKDICRRLDLLEGASKAKTEKQLLVSNMYCTIANEAFVQIYEKYHEDGLIVKMEEGFLPETIAQVASGQSEIGVVVLFSDSENVSLKLLEEKDLEFNHIVKRRLYAIVGPENPLYNKDCSWINLADLKDYPYITNYASPSDYAWERALGGRNHRRAEIQVNDLGCALQLIDRTDAVMIDTLDDEAYKTFHAENRCRFILIKDAPLTCRVGWIKLKNRTLSPVCQEYIRVLTEKAQNCEGNILV